MLTLTETPCRLGKISNNLEKHGEDDVTAFDLPVTVELKSGQLDAVLEDKLFSKRLYDTGSRGKPPRPGEGFGKLKPLELRDSFEEVLVELTVRGKILLTFENCKLSKMTFEACLGGVTECNFSIRLRPKTDKEILQLLHHQKREVEISTTGGKVIVSKRQQDLPLEPKAESGEGEDDDKEPSNGESSPPGTKWGEDAGSNIAPIR